MSVGASLPWALRVLEASLAFQGARSSFRSSATPRYTALRATTTVFGIAVFAASTMGFWSGYEVPLPWRQRLGAGAFWVVLIGLPALAGAVVGRHENSRTTAGKPRLARTDLSWRELFRRAERWTLIGVASGGAVVVLFNAVPKLGLPEGAGFVVFGLGVVAALGLIVASGALFDRHRPPGGPARAGATGGEPEVPVPAAPKANAAPHAAPAERSSLGQKAAGWRFPLVVGGAATVVWLYGVATLGAFKAWGFAIFPLEALAAIGALFALLFGLLLLLGIGLEPLGGVATSVRRKGKRPKGRCGLLADTHSMLPQRGASATLWGAPQDDQF